MCNLLRTDDKTMIVDGVARMESSSEIEIIVNKTVKAVAEGHCPDCGSPLSRHAHPSFNGLGVYQVKGGQFGSCPANHGCFRLDGEFCVVLVHTCHLSYLRKDSAYFPTAMV